MIRSAISSGVPSSAHGLAPASNAALTVVHPSGSIHVAPWPRGYRADVERGEGPSRAARHTAGGEIEPSARRACGVTAVAHPVQQHLPLKIGAMGARMSTELAGEIADGLHTACAYSPDALGYAVQHSKAGVERAARSPDGLVLGEAGSGSLGPDLRSRALQNRLDLNRTDWSIDLHARCRETRARLEWKRSPWSPSESC